MLVCEAGECEGGHGGEENERGVEEDETGLGNQSII
jgi:hypothetical protein